MESQIATAAATQPDGDARQPTSTELRLQAQALLEQAEQIRSQELAGVIQQIRSLSTQYGLGAEDIFGGRKVRTPGKNARPSTGGYRCPTSGSIWSGRGRRPQWIKDAMAAGTNIETFKVA